ncbi:alpha/beta hydrolase fold domain-containing protein [Synechococcus sp. CS-1332]|uniref:alpha/beta hydrolase fold domain-containing protein n=1 Tax=Synechococcus sp. CS-1332 TaxID=2847972 RepID=UPI0037DA3549
MGWAKRIAGLSRQTVVAIHYRLAPEHRYPRALDDVIGMLRALQKTSVGQITVGGDDTLRDDGLDFA